MAMMSYPVRKSVLSMRMKEYTDKEMKDIKKC